MEGLKEMIFFLKVLILWYFSLYMLFFLIFSSTKIKLFGGSNESTEEKRIRIIGTYKTVEINTFSNHTSFGIVSIPNLSVPNEGLFVQSSKEGRYTLTSNFGSNGNDQYYCTGSCFCASSEDEISRRRNGLSQAISRGVVYLVAATTSILAFNKAGEYFQNHCQNTLQDECPQNSEIVSEIEGCEPIISVSKKQEEEEQRPRPLHEKEEQDFEEIYDYQQRNEFLCSGSCRLLDEWKDVIEKFLETVDEHTDNPRFRYFFKHATQHDQLKSDIRFLTLRHEVCKKIRISSVVTIEDRNFNTARARFSDDLDDFCKSSSKVKGVKVLEKKGKSGSWCGGKVKWLRPKLKNIFCLPMNEKFYDELID